MMPKTIAWVSIKTLAVMLLLQHALVVQAQVDFGITAGINYGSVIPLRTLPPFYWPGQDVDIDPNYRIEYPARTSFHLGLSSHIHVSGKLYTDVSLLYSQKGSKFRRTDLSGKPSGTIVVNTLEIPILISYQILKRLSISGGYFWDFDVIKFIQDDLEISNDILTFLNGNRGIGLHYSIIYRLKQNAFSFRYARGGIFLGSNHEKRYLTLQLSYTRFLFKNARNKSYIYAHNQF